MDFRLKCCLLYLVTLGCFTHVTSQDTASPESISKSHATNGGVHVTAGNPSKPPGTGNDEGKEASTIKPIHDATPDALGLQLAHTTQPTHDAKHGAFAGKMIPHSQSIDQTTVGAVVGKQAHTLHPGPDSSPDKGAFAGKKILHSQSIDETTVGAVVRKQAHTLHPGPDSSPGAVKATEVHSPDRSRDTTTGTFGGAAVRVSKPIPDAAPGSVGEKAAHTMHPAHKTTLALTTTTSHHRVLGKPIISTVEESHHLVAHVKIHRPKHLTNRIIHPPTVDPVVLQNDYIILCVCAPGIVFWLIVLVIVTIRRKRKGKAQRRTFQNQA